MRMKSSSSGIIGWVFLAVLLSRSAHGGEFIDLSASSETDSGANAINASGVIVGYRETQRKDPSGSPIFDAFICKGAISYPLRLGLPDLVSSFAAGINASGQVVGYYIKSDKSTSGFLYMDGQATEIREPGSLACYVEGINDSGQVIGNSYFPDGSKHGFLYLNGVFTPIALPDATLTPKKINNKGEVIGSAFGNSQSFIFSYLNGTVTSIRPEDDSVSYGIKDVNDSGQILVSRYSEADGGQYGFYGSGSFSPIPVNGTLNALNNRGDLAGTEALTPSPGVPQGAKQLILIQAGQVQRLGSLGGAKVEVSDLNDAGQAVGYAETLDKKYHTFLYSPVLVVSPGDLNGDRKVDVSDVVRTLLSVVGLATLTADEFRAADVVSDQKLKVSDVVKMLRVVVGIDAGF